MASVVVESALENSDSTKVTSYAWVVWGLAAIFFFAEYLARVAPTVMMSELIRSLAITATGFGTLTACFYWTYIPMQIPVGLLVDRFSIRLLLVTMACVTALSCAIFAGSSSLTSACVSRLLLGFGASFAFVGAIKLASMWFPASKLGLIAGFTQAIGMLGAASGEFPVAYMVGKLGWRPTLYAMVIGFVLLAILMLFIIRDKQQVQSQSIKHQRNIWLSLTVVLKNPQSWWNALYAGLLFVPTAVLGESWGVEYLKHSHGLDLHQAAIANGMIFIGWGLGGPIVGALSDLWMNRKQVMIVSNLMSLICMGLLVWGPAMSGLMICVVLFVYGFSNTGVGVAYALATEINPKEDSGMSIAFANMGSIMIGAALLPMVGQLIDWHSHGMNGSSLHYSGEDFSFAMNLMPLALMICLIAVCFIKETHCRPYSGE